MVYTRFVSLMAVVCAVGAALPNEPLQRQPCGQVSTVTGDVVSIDGVRRTALEPGATVYPDELVISNGGRAALLLNGDDRYEIYPNSRTLIRIPPSISGRIQNNLAGLKAVVGLLFSSKTAWPSSTTIIAVRG